jgi:hypothetical protein
VQNGDISEISYLFFAAERSPAPEAVLGAPSQFAQSRSGYRVYANGTLALFSSWSCLRRKPMEEEAGRREEGLGWRGSREGDGAGQYPFGLCGGVNVSR